MRKVRHKNVVQFIGACTRQPNLCILVEYMAGGSVYDHMRSRGLFRLTKVAEIALQVAKGVPPPPAHLPALAPQWGVLKGGVLAVLPPTVPPEWVLCLRMLSTEWANRVAPVRRHSWSSAITACVVPRRGAALSLPSSICASNVPCWTQRSLRSSPELPCCQLAPCCCRHGVPPPARHHPPRPQGRQPAARRQPASQDRGLRGRAPHRQGQRHDRGDGNVPVDGAGGHRAQGVRLQGRRLLLRHRPLGAPHRQGAVHGADRPPGAPPSWPLWPSLRRCQACLCRDLAAPGRYPLSPRGGLCARLRHCHSVCRCAWQHLDESHAAAASALSVRIHRVRPRLPGVVEQARVGCPASLPARCRGRRRL